MAYIFSLLCESETVPASRVPCESVSVFCLCIFPCVYLSDFILGTGLCSVFIEQLRQYPMGEGRGYFTEILTKFHKGLSHWIWLTPTDPESKQYYKHHCSSANVHMSITLCSNFIVNFRWLISTFIFTAFNNWIICITLGQGMEE